jgi:hypothetical protein
MKSGRKAAASCVCRNQSKFSASNFGVRDGEYMIENKTRLTCKTIAATRSAIIATGDLQQSDAGRVLMRGLMV